MRGGRPLSIARASTHWHNAERRGTPLTAWHLSPRRVCVCVCSMSSPPVVEADYSAIRAVPFRRVVVPARGAAASTGDAMATTSKLPNAPEIFSLIQLGVFPVDQFVAATLCREPKPLGATEETVELVELEANTQYQPHYHQHAKAVIYMIAGTGLISLDGVQQPYAPQQRFMINCGVRHGFHTNEKTFFLSLQAPPIIDKASGIPDIFYDVVPTGPTDAAVASPSPSPIASATPNAAAVVPSPSSGVVGDPAGPAGGFDPVATADRSIRLNTAPRKGRGCGTGIPGNMGLDHVGFVVPNVREATDFLVEVFDAEFDWEVVRESTPTSGQRGWDAKFGVHPDSFMPHVVMLKCGDGVLTQYIELFEWSSPDQYKPPNTHPLNAGWNKFSDIGNSYFSFTVKDLSAVMSHCKAHVFTRPAWSRCRFVQDPPMDFPLRGEVCTSTFLVSPWGQWIELTCWSASKHLKDAIVPQQAPLVDARLGRSIFDLATPAFMIDLDVVDHNVGLLKQRIVDAGLLWRIPAKAHKCPELAKYIQRTGGACGVVLLTLQEVEQFAAAGVEDIYLANQVASEDEVRRLTLVAKKVKRLRVSVDDREYLRQLAAQVAAWEITTPIEVLVELNVNHNRLGVGVGEATEIAKLAWEIQAKTGALLFKGITGYEGHTPILPLTEKTAQTNLSHSILAQAKAAIEAAGIPVEIVSGGGSCNYMDCLAAGVVNELQCGGGAVCDSLYYEKAGLKQFGHRIGAFVLAQVVSAPADDLTRATANAGFKAVGWHPFGGLPLLRDHPHVRCNGLSAEHTRLVGVDLEATASATAQDPAAPLVKAPIGLKRGDKVVLTPGYTDAACVGSFHKEIHAFRRDLVEHVWKTIDTE